jgi:hypothetical protein
MWDTLSMAKREEWVEEESKRYDRFNRLVSMTVLPIYVNQGSALLTAQGGGCRIDQNDEEAALLSYFWDGMMEANVNQFQICGWRIRELAWPRLVNRSVALGVKMPAWAKPDLSKKWFDVQLHDLSALYSCGVWGRVRPLPPIHYALKFWLGRNFPREDEIQLKAEYNPNDESIRDATCDYVNGMAEVLQRYVK